MARTYKRVKTGGCLSRLLQFIHRWLIRAVVLGGVVIVVFKASHWLPPGPVPEFLQQLDDQATAFVIDRGREVFRQLPRRDEKPSGTIEIRRSKPETWREVKPPRAPAAVRAARRGVVTVSSVAGSPAVTADGKYVTSKDQGTGFVVWRDEFKVLIVTAAHTIVSPAVDVALGSRPGLHPADLVKSDPATDLALLRLSTRAVPSLPVLPLAGKSAIKSASPCWVLTTGQIATQTALGGFYVGRPSSIEKEISITYGAPRFRGSWFVISQATRRGFSGAPVVSADGRTIGVLVAGIDSPKVSSKSLAVGLEGLRRFLRQAAPQEFR